MELGTVSALLHLTSQEPEPAQARDTSADRSMKFAEEASFFFGFFKNFQVRPMPDQPLMLLLQKSKLRQQERSVKKKEKAQGSTLRKQREQNDDQGLLDEGDEFED